MTGITLDGSTPAAVDNTASTSATAVTASFSPPANSMVVIVVNIGYEAADSDTPAVAVSDSLSNSYTAGPGIWGGSTYSCGSWIFTRWYSAAPGSITVTATRSGTDSADQALFELVPYVLTGSTSTQAGAASGTATGVSTSLTHAITSTVSGSWVIVGVTAYNDYAFTASNMTADHIEHDVTDLEEAGAGHAVTGTPGTETIGFTMPTSDGWTWAALEILPNVTTTVTPAAVAVTASCPAPAAGTGDTAAPAALAAAASLPAPAAAGGANPAPAALAASLSVPAPAVITSVSVTATPAALTRSAAFPAPAPSASTVTTIITASQTWTCPPGVIAVQVQCTGPGGPGAAGLSNTYAGAGGGGGEYAADTVDTTPGNGYGLTCAPGAATVFPGDNKTVTANPGGAASGYASPGAGGTGSTNSTHYSGTPGTAGVHA
jgi:hypothetical protein